jgi:3-methyl-2-oxobutanoate hydroxymethyltransferase
VELLINQERGKNQIMPDNITVPAILARKGKTKLRMVTAYDAPSARIADQAGADLILVGDSLASTVLGYEDTLSVTVEDMLHHTAAVTRIKPHALVIGDLPWLSYHISVEETVRNAGRFLREAHAGAVKLEGGRKRLPMIKALLDAEMPVMGHLGLTPQSIHTMGGYQVQGRRIEGARELLEDARALADAGVFALVLEGIPDILARIVTTQIAIPTIGIGAGPYCDGQVLVFDDVLGLSSGHLPKFVRQYAHLAENGIEALKRFFADVQEGNFPTDAESYHVNAELAQEIAQILRKNDAE